MANAHRICESMGIKLHGRAKRNIHPGAKGLPARQTWSGQTIRTIAEMGEQAGLPNHVYDMLGLIIASKPNDGYLYEDVIQGVSHWGLAWRIASEEVAFLQEPFEAVDLAALRANAKRCPIRPRSMTMAIQISGLMGESLETLRT